MVKEDSRAEVLSSLLYLVQNSVLDESTRKAITVEGPPSRYRIARAAWANLVIDKPSGYVSWERAKEIFEITDEVEAQEGEGTE